MSELRCPKCKSESIIWARVPGLTCKVVMSPFAICRGCWNKDRVEKFEEEYNKSHPELEAMAWDPWKDIGYKY